MNPELQRAITELITTVNSGAAQLPAVIQEKLTWSTTAHTIFLLFGIILVSVGMAVFYHGKQMKDTCYSDKRPATMACGGIVAVIGGIYILYNSHELIMITVAPKLYILEWLRHLL